MLDTLFNLEDFKSVIDDYGVSYKDLRICVFREQVGYFTNIKIILSVAVVDKGIIIRCIVGERAFHSVFIEHVEEEKEKLKSFIQEAYKKVEEKFGFIPKEGYWSKDLKEENVKIGKDEKSANDCALEV